MARNGVATRTTAKAAAAKLATAKVPTGAAAATVSAEAATRGERTKAAIKQAILKLAMKRDLSEIALADICKAARVTTGALYFHFTGKDDAVEAMVLDQLAEIYGTLAGAAPAADAAGLIGRVVANTARFHQRGPKLAGVIEATVQTRPRVYAAWLEARRPVVAALEQAIAAARVARGLPPDGAAYLAHIVLTSVEDLAVDTFRWQNPTLAPFAEDIEAWVARQTAFWSFAILAPLP